MEGPVKGESENIVLVLSTVPNGTCTEEKILHLLQIVVLLWKILSRPHRKRAAAPRRATPWGLRYWTMFASSGRAPRTTTRRPGTAFHLGPGMNLLMKFVSKRPAWK